jgi:hypothetical protein
MMRERRNERALQLLEEGREVARLMKSQLEAPSHHTLGTYRIVVIGILLHLEVADSPEIFNPLILLSSRFRGLN